MQQHFDTILLGGSLCGWWLFLIEVCGHDGRLVLTRHACMVLMSVAVFTPVPATWSFLCTCYMVVPVRLHQPSSRRLGMYIDMLGAVTTVHS